MPKCVPCLGTAIKQAVLGANPDLAKDLARIADCSDPIELNLCGGRGGKDGRRVRLPRQKSEYQIWISTCLKGKNIHGFGAASPALKQCAQEWQEHKKAKGM